MVKQRWSGTGQLALMVDAITEVQTDGGAQCFPLYLYDGADGANDDQDEDAKAGDVSALPFAAARTTPSGRRDGVTDAGLAHFRSAYPATDITKEDVFYYVYGVLHSADYRERYADNLGKDLPRMPRVKTAADFWSFSRAGRALGELHVGYERVPEYDARVEGPAKPTSAQHRVERMKFGKGKDKSVIHYNEFITIHNIPVEAYDYLVNGRSAIEWVMERQSVTTDKASGIVKDANAWATETVGDARYPLSLLLRVITVSLETMKIVRDLPALDIMDDVAPASAPADAQVVTFRRVSPKPDERFKSCVPLVDLHAAAGAWSDVQEAVPELDDPGLQWVAWDGAPRFTKDMFVARVQGRSMLPDIPDGAYCLFRRVALPSSPDRAVLVRHAGAANPETGGQYTVKRYREEKGTNGEKRVVLQPTNPEFAPIVITPHSADEVRVVAEVVETLSG
jgi:SOS-response transcriptional repressor LexA